EQSLSISSEKIPLPNNIFKDFTNDIKNHSIIRDWILEDLSDKKINDYINEFDIKSCSDSLSIQKKVEKFLEILFGTIKEKKKQCFSQETLNILSFLNRIEDKLDYQTNIIEPISESVQYIPQMATDISQIKEQLNYITGQKNLINIPEGIKIKGKEKYKENLKEIKNLLDKNKNYSARNEAINLIRQLKVQSSEDKETLYSANIYIAQTYINSFFEQEKAIPYLIESIKNCKDEERKLQNQALIHLLDGEFCEGLEIIDKALKINPKNIQSIDIKANLLVLDKKPQDAINLFQDEDLNREPDILYIKSFVESKLNDFQSALKSINEVIKNKPNYYGAYLLHGDIVIFQIQNLLKNNKKITENHYKSINTALEQLSKVINDLNENEQKGILSKAYSNRGLIYVFLCDFKKGESDFIKANELFNEDPEILRNLILTLAANGDYGNALKHLQQLKKLKPEDSEYKLIESQINIFMGYPQNAISILEDEIKKQNLKSPDFRFHNLLIDAYDKDIQTKKAEDKLDEFEKRFGSIPEIILAKAKHLRLLGKYDDAINILKKVINKSENKTKLLIKILLADILCDRREKNDFKKAARLYEPISNIYVNDEILKRYLSSLYNSNQFEKCFELCQNIKEIHDYDDFYIELEGAIFYKLENYQPASEIYKILYQKYPHKINCLMNYGNCLFRLRKVNEAVDALRQAEKRLNGSAQDLAFISSVYSYYGKFEDALELAYQALNKDTKDPNLHLYYAGLFLRAENYISNIDKKYILLFQDTLNNFNKRFPDNKSLEKHTIPKDPNKFKAEIKKLLDTKSNRIEEVERIYNRDRLPIGFFAHSVGKDIITTWSFITSHKMLKLWISSGEISEYQKEMDIADKSTSIIIDIVALLTFKALNILNLLPNVFNEIFICQSILDEFQKLIALKYVYVKHGYTSIINNKGEIYRIDISPEYIKRDITFLEDIVNFIT
ncbi:MAG: tetratricopeptide repeat protein, partial [Promethearchaeota archaeon]